MSKIDIIILVFASILTIPFTFWLVWILAFGGSATNIKLYRWYKGGVWYRYFPKMYPYMSFWTQDKEGLYSHEIIDLEEHYTKK